MEGVNRLAKEQNEILRHIEIAYGIEFLTCGNCAVMVAVDWRDRHSPLNWKMDSQNINIITCWNCGAFGESADFPDLTQPEGG